MGLICVFTTAAVRGRNQGWDSRVGREQLCLQGWAPQESLYSLRWGVEFRSLKPIHLLLSLHCCPFCPEWPGEQFPVHSAQGHCSEGAAGAELAGLSLSIFPGVAAPAGGTHSVQTARSTKEGCAGTSMGHFPAGQSCNIPFTESGKMLKTQKIRGFSSNLTAHGCPSPAPTTSTAAPGWSKGRALLASSPRAVWWVDHTVISP